jgi:hypothetical protein
MKSECIRNAVKLWTSEPEVGKTFLKQTPDFKEAVEECLRRGHETVQIALCINFGRYKSDQKDRMYDKTSSFVNKHRAAWNKNKKL